MRIPRSESIASRVVITTLLLVFSNFLYAQQADSTFYAELNKMRRWRLMRPLKIDTVIAAGAIKWAEVQNKNNLFHNTRDEFAEVLVKNSADPLKSWMNSPPHRKILLGRKYRYIGFGYAWVDGSLIGCARLK